MMILPNHHRLLIDRLYRVDIARYRSLGVRSLRHPPERVYHVARHKLKMSEGSPITPYWLDEYTINNSVK